MPSATWQKCRYRWCFLVLLPSYYRELFDGFHRREEVVQIIRLVFLLGEPVITVTDQRGLRLIGAVCLLQLVAEGVPG